MVYKVIQIVVLQYKAEQGIGLILLIVLCGAIWQVQLEISADKSPKQKDKNMTVLEGFGMLGVGILALIIGGGIAFYVINKVMEEDDDDDSIY